MAEPRAIAKVVDEVLPGVLRWWVSNERIGGAESTSHAVRADDGLVFIDPVRLADDVLGALGEVSAVCLTAQCHQRSAWRYRRTLGAPVWAPEGTRPMEEEPDERYREGDELPGGLQALRTPGPEEVHFSFLRAGEPRILFCSDIFTHYEGRDLEFVPFEYHDDAEETKRTARGLLDVDFDVLCLDHGSPVADDPKTAIRGLLDRTG